MNTLGDVIVEVQGLLGDPDGEWVTREYILPLIGTTYRMQYLAIKNACGRNLEQVVEVLAIAPGTTSLYPLQSANQPLQGLTDPLHLWWKQAGQNPANYQPMSPVGTIPFSSYAGGSSYGGRACYTWRGSQLFVTQFPFAVDMLVDGRFNPPPLTDDAQVLVVSPDMQSTLALGSAALAGVERTNPALLTNYEELAVEGVNNIVADLIRQKQGFTKQMGRVAPQGWRWGR